MTAIFKKHQINDLSLGEILELERKRKNIDLPKAAELTKINPEYLRALENGDYEKLPNGVYGKNFLRQYCLFLGLKYKNLLPIYEREQAVVTGEPDNSKMFSRQRARQRYFFLFPKLWRSILLVVVVLAGFIYIGYRIKEIVAPPDVNLFFPPPNYVTSENAVEIKGNIESDALLFVNDVEVITQESGDFSEEINLKKGMNIITIKAQKKYGKDSVLTRQILVK